MEQPRKKRIIKEEFSSRLSLLMDEQNETVYSLGDVLSLSAATISRYASGQVSPKITTIEAMAKHFNVNPVWLMGYDVEKQLDFQKEQQGKKQYFVTESEAAIIKSLRYLKPERRQDAIIGIIRQIVRQYSEERREAGGPPLKNSDVYELIKGIVTNNE